MHTYVLYIVQLFPYTEIHTCSLVCVHIVGYEDDYAYSQRQPPATRQHAWEEPTSILPQALGQQNQRTQEPPYNQREPYDSYYNSDGFATRDPRYGRDPPGPRDPFSGTHSSQSVESGYATGVQHTGQRSHDHSFELGPQESPTNFPPVPPRTRLRNPQPMDHDDNIDNDCKLRSLLFSFIICTYVCTHNDTLSVKYVFVIFRC